MYIYCNYQRYVEWEFFLMVKWLILDVQIFWEFHENSNLNIAWLNLSDEHVNEIFFFVCSLIKSLWHFWLLFEKTIWYLFVLLCNGAQLILLVLLQEVYTFYKDRCHFILFTEIWIWINVVKSPLIMFVIVNCVTRRCLQQ